MEMVTSYERIARKEGIEVGRKKGIAVGIKKGREEGRVEGAREIAIKMVMLLLQEKFGQLPDWAEQKVRKAELPQLEGWARAIVSKSFLHEILI